LMADGCWTLDALEKAVANAGVPSGGNTWTANPGNGSK
jgi:hypothetical protein